MEIREAIKDHLRKRVAQGLREPDLVRRLGVHRVLTEHELGEALANSAEILSKQEPLRRAFRGPRRFEAAIDEFLAWAVAANGPLG